MANEIPIVVTGEDRSGPAMKSADTGAKKLKGSVEEVGKAHDQAGGRVSNFGKSLASTNRVSEANKESAKALGVGVLAAGAAFTAANKVMNDGIAIRLRSANAQVALGDSYGTLHTAALETAHSIGLTTSEYEQAAGMTASLAKNMGFAADTATQFGMMMPDLSNKLSILSNGTRSAADAGDMMRAAMAGEFDPLQTLGINISANIVQQKAMALQLQNGKKFTDQQANALAVLSIVQGQTADASKTMATEAGKAAMAAQKNSAEMKQAWEDIESGALPALSHITQYVGDTVSAMADLKGALTGEQGLGGGFKTVINATNPLTNVLDRVLGKTNENTDANKKATPSVEELAKAEKGSAQSAEALADATKEATEKIEELAGVALDASEAQIGWEESIDDAADALKENGSTLDITTQKGRDNQSALNDMAKAAMDQAKAVREAGGTEEQFRNKLNESRGALVRMAEKMGMSKKAANNYADAVLSIPKARQTTIKLETQQALGQLSYLRGVIRNLDGSVIHVRAKAVLDDSAVRGIATGGIGGAASGGARSRMTWVGERGPELVNLPPGSQVHSNPDSQRMVRDSQQRSGGGGGVATVEFVSDDAGLLTLLRRLVRVNGGSAEVVFSTRRGVAS